MARKITLPQTDCGKGSPHVTVKLSGYQGLLLPSNVAGVDAGSPHVIVAQWIPRVDLA